MDEIFSWAVLAEKFFENGDAESMRGAAQEILELDKNSAEGNAIFAEAALYLGELDAAKTFAEKSLSTDPDNLRGRLILGGIAAENFRLKEEFKILNGVIEDCRSCGENFLARKILFKALCWISDGLYLAGESIAAAENLLEASGLTENKIRAAEIYSKHLFLRNYRDTPPEVIKNFAKGYNKFFADVKTFRHEKNFSAAKKIKIGYISPDFRYHAVANFIQPLLKNFDREKFSVTCYHTGKSDSVTDIFRRNKISWRDLSSYDAQDAAQIIFRDRIEILVDLSGHSQNNCLPIMAHKPAPIQITALGYTATTGLAAIDYFLSDKISSPENSTGFTEKILRVDGCHLCYAPIIPLPEILPRAEKNFVTFGSFNNFAKISDDVLKIWREILAGVPESNLIIKGKICSVEDGRAIVIEKLRKNNFPLDRVELRPYSRDYLEQYRDIDIALDTFPYNGGATTCEALFMGVPVVVLRGKNHGSNFGASILTAANFPELIAENPDDYIKKAVRLGRHKRLLTTCHMKLREKILKSSLPDRSQYIKELEKIYRSLSVRKNSDDKNL